MTSAHTADVAAMTRLSPANLEAIGSAVCDLWFTQSMIAAEIQHGERIAAERERNRIFMEEIRG